MQHKHHGKIVVILACFMLLLTTLMNTLEVRAPGDATINVTPDFIQAAPGENWTVTYNATNVDTLGVWQVVLKYNATLINVTSLWIPDDNIFGNPAVYQQQRVEPIYGFDFVDGLGYVGYGNSLFVGEVQVTNGVLFKMNFTVLNEGTTSLTTTTKSNPARIGPRIADTLNTFLATWSDQYQEYRDIPQTLIVTSASVISGGGLSKPIAVFTLEASIPDRADLLVLPGHKPIGDTDFAQAYKMYPIIFNASTSMGLLTLPNGTRVMSNSAITTYYWDFGDGQNITTNTSIIEHTYINTGNWFVTLSVEDNNVPPQTSETATKLMVIGLVLEYFNWTPVVYTVMGLIGVLIAFLLFREIRGYMRSRRMMSARRLASKRPISSSR